MSVRSRRHDVVVAERAKYVVDTDALGARQRVDACRLVLTVAAEDIATFETDIPWASAADWPEDVRRAADFLTSLKERSRGETMLYRRTGDVPNDHDRAWEAFVKFAPYAFDASAWTAASQQVAALSDAGESVVAALTSVQVKAVSLVMGEDLLVPLREWRMRRP